MNYSFIFAFLLEVVEFSLIMNGMSLKLKKTKRSMLTKLLRGELTEPVKLFAVYFTMFQMSARQDVISHLFLGNLTPDQVCGPHILSLMNTLHFLNQRYLQVAK